MSAPEPDPDPQVRFDVQITPEMEAGVYANFLNVWHTAHEFTLDFASTMPAEQGTDELGAPGVRIPARVAVRVKVPPTLMFDIIRAINDNLTRYEATFGAISRPSDGPPLYPDDA
jgi:hypothetical protein